ncbi:hypothetical protein B0H14DRAFT_2807830 [Mycena olivaceomarginata]|nr:hypothetical protein B0H14DRAFT_2807830 [Mycena olivaceomarginata]
MRRSSLSDLKIPARISQAQVGLRRDLSIVREFARNVEELKELQGTYQTLASEVQGILDMHVLHPSKEEKDPACTSPTFFKRHCSNTSSSTDAPSPTIQQQSQQAYKQLTSSFYTINSKYRISWECAELLIELGGGGSSSSPPRTSTSAPAMQQSVGRSEGLKSKREQAIALQDAAKVPPSPGPLTTTPSLPCPPLARPPNYLACRASTKRNDLSQRQLLLLKEMLNPTPGGPDESFAEDIPKRLWPRRAAARPTVTLPSKEGGVQGGVPSKEQKWRSSRMRMSGIRDMLRALTKGGGTPPVPVSLTSVSTESSSVLHAQHLYQHRQVKQSQSRRAKASAGPESASIRSTHRPLSPFDPSSLKTASPRRPSLASIFWIGKGKIPPPFAVADASLDNHEVYATFSGISGGRESASNSAVDGEDTGLQNWCNIVLSMFRTFLQHPAIVCRNYH